MELMKIDNQNIDLLFDYWNKVGTGIPYFYKTSKKAFMKSLFEDTFNGLEILKENYIYVAIEDGVTKGFIQYGIPYFHYVNGKMINDPNIGVIRNIYFDHDRVDIGRKLLALSKIFFDEKDVDDVYAFYHAMGMSCNGNHGKLHERYNYISELLLDEGFEIEHENVYYSLILSKNQIKQNVSLSVHNEQFNKEKLELILDGNKVGGAEIKFIDAYTGLNLNKIIYLVWIYIDKAVKGQGIGTEFMKLIQNYYISRGYNIMHTDTAIDNKVAQKYYERNKFESLGITRSFQRLKAEL